MSKRKQADVEQIMERACEPIKKELEMLNSIVKDLDNLYYPNRAVLMSSVIKGIGLLKLQAYSSYFNRIAGETECS